MDTLPQSISISACTAPSQWPRRHISHSSDGLQLQGFYGSSLLLLQKGLSSPIQFFPKLLVNTCSIPNFNNLLGVVSSLFASWFTYGVSGIFWLFINSGKWFSTPSKTFLTIINWLLIIMAAAVCGIGMYSSGMAINGNDGKGGAWACRSGTAK